MKNKEDGIRLMGFGHRVYKNFDPRAQLVKESADEVLAALGVNDPLLDIAKELEQAALADDYFVERKLYPNVDFYTGVIYKAMGFPTRMFTVLFAIGRLPGWIAHWREATNDPATKIGRPQQLYVGPPSRPWPTDRCTLPLVAPAPYSPCAAPSGRRKPQPHVPVDDMVDEGLMIVAATVRMPVKKLIIVQALRDKHDFDEDVMLLDVQSELRRLAHEKREDGYRIELAGALADGRFGKARHQCDYHESDLKSLERRQEVSRRLAERLDELSHDEVVRPLARRAGAEARSSDSSGSNVELAIRDRRRPAVHAA